MEKNNFDVDISLLPSRMEGFNTWVRIANECRCWIVRPVGGDSEGRFAVKKEDDESPLDADIVFRGSHRECRSFILRLCAGKAWEVAGELNRHEITVSDK